ncbi:hypothetical protein CXB51_016887 [Gossypium anomalum]|uniref:BHLH domain-containing protein n=1 Tax=Gossypium anomalum TaxID=47600 RepID=A0A8J5YTT9_9ROSI|nr:hypothetical protein CXB51_016887 [Gossypium anomalum]
MTSDLPNVPSMRNPDFMELVWENGQVLIRGLSSKVTQKSSPFSSCSTANGSKDGGVADSTFAHPISGLSSLSKLDRHGLDANIVPVNNFNRLKPSYVPKQLVEYKAPCSSLQQFKGPKEEKDRVNFSILRSNHASSGAMSTPGLAAGAEDLQGNNVRSARPRSSNIPVGNEGDFMAKRMRPTLPDSEPLKESFPDEQSEAVPKTRLAPDDTAFKGNPDQMVASSSLCSRGASNCPTYTFKTRYEDTDLSKNTTMEEAEGTTKAAPVPRGSKGAKRKRKTEVHNLSERRRRDKINKKMRALKELIPNCNKVDKASMLDEAIEYLKTLQLQVQMMSIGNGVYMPPMMFPLPSAMQHINAQHLGGYSPMALGMGMRMQMGLGCGAPPQFPTSIMTGAPAVPGNPEARLNMLGIPDQMLLRSMSHSPFLSSAASFTPQSVQPPAAVVSQSAAPPAAQVDLLGGANPLPTSKDSYPTH